MPVGTKKVTYQDLESMAMTLLMLARDYVGGWQEHFSEEQVRALRDMWNDGMSVGDNGYWY